MFKACTRGPGLFRLCRSALLYLLRTSNVYLLWSFIFLKQWVATCGYVVQVESSDLISYGLIPEFIGRFPVLVSLSALNEDQLVQVLFVF
jgi:hypothetical protein